MPVSAVFFIGTELYAWYQTHPQALREIRIPVAVMAVCAGPAGLCWMTLSPLLPGWLESFGVSSEMVRWARNYQSRLHVYLIPVAGTMTILVCGTPISVVLPWRRR